jgi:hypothetical protein
MGSSPTQSKPDFSQLRQSVSLSITLVFSRGAYEGCTRRTARMIRHGFKKKRIQATEESVKEHSLKIPLVLREVTRSRIK